MTLNIRNGLMTASLFCLAGASGAMAQDIKVGHLTYHTGEFAAWADFFDGVSEMAISLVNQDPPLGRTFTMIQQDIGTVGEAMAARKLVDSDGVDILLNPAHGYMAYRSFAMEQVERTGLPLMPSVHGGAIDGVYGGTAQEPLFRGSPMDSAQGTAALLHAAAAGKSRVAIIATEIAGSQLQKDAATRTANAMGLEIVGTYDVQPNQPNYRSIVTRVVRDEPEVVIVFSAPIDGGTIVKNAAEAGASWFIVGNTEWQELEFVNTATQSAIDRHEEVVFAAFTHQEGPAWDYYEPFVSGSPYAEAIGDVRNSYALQYYDLMLVTALAIEKAGTLEAGAWTEAMHQITGGDGEIVHTYADGLEAIRAGREINYDGVSGTMEYNETGMVSGLFGIFEWQDGEMVLVDQVDGNEVLAYEM